MVGCLLTELFHLADSYPYDANMQQKLEAAYKSKQKMMSFDVKNENYVVDFKQMLQINQRDNSKVRKVTREKVKEAKTAPQQPTINKQAALQKSKSASSLATTRKVEPKPPKKSPSPSKTMTMTSAPNVPHISDKKSPQPTWQWQGGQDDKGDWQKFEDNLQVLLESRFQDEIETYTFSRDGNLYDINFTNMTQTSRLPYPKTKSIRRIHPKNDSYLTTLLGSFKSTANGWLASVASPSIEEAKPAATAGNTLDLPDDVPHVWYFIDDDGAKIKYTEENQKKLESCRSNGRFFATIFIGCDYLLVDMEEMKQTKCGDQKYSLKKVIREPKKLTDRNLHSTKTDIGETPQPSYVWYYEDAYGAKAKYDNNNQKQLESCYIEGKEVTSIQIDFDSYTVNFKEMKHTSWDSKTEAKIFREPAALK
ncbi:Hypothetical predicted protein [Cloeon dipterum]|uniref:E3 ubiquitin-protein ligase n=1 Tax=Cloeon dipterum TaxID=197152 RepID=A0A8S1CAM7_9INSE|nr:Hypothetical predicted protein [Cloeon dipterum]